MRYADRAIPVGSRWPRRDASARLFAEQSLIRVTLALVCLLERIEAAQPLVPIRFERIGDEAIVGIDLQITPSREFSRIPRAFKLCPTQRIGLCDATGDLVLYGERNLQRGGRHRLQQQRTECGVHVESTD